MKINNHVRGILCIVSAAFFFSLMSVLVRLAGDLPTMEKAFFRNAIAAVYSIVMLSRSQEKFHVMEGSWPGLLKRASFGTLGLVTNFWAIDHIGLADSNVLNKMAPFFAIMLSTVILGEKASRKEWLLVVGAFIGAALIIKPSAGVASLPALVGLVSGFGAGAAYTYVRQLGKRGERGPVIVWVFSCFSCLFCIPFVVFNYKPMTLVQFIILMGAGTAGMGGQLSVTAAYTYAPAKDISVFDYTQVIFASAWGFFVFSETPDVYSVCGYVIIVMMALLRWMHTRKEDHLSEK